MLRLCIVVLALTCAQAAYAQVAVCDCAAGLKNGATKAACDALFETMDQETALSKVMDCHREQVLAGDANFCNCTRAATAEPAFVEACQSVYDKVATMSPAELSRQAVACSPSG